MGQRLTKTQQVADTKVLRAIDEQERKEREERTPSGVQTKVVADLPRLGRFQTSAELGSGGMGTVFRATDDVLGREVAIKALHANEDPGIRERFLREAKAIGAVRHPNILAIYDAGTEGQIPFLVMELANGGSLRDRIKVGPLGVDDVRQVGIQISGALAAAHAARILHRDIKPGNILTMGDGVWKLADFGIARLPDSKLTVTGQFLGSPSYAAPESLRAGEFSPASDVYGLGATLYEALTGQPPYGDHDMQSLVRKLEEDAPPLHTRTRVTVPGPLGDAIMASLSRDPTKRPTAEQLGQMLSALEPPAKRAPAAAAAAAGGWTRTQKLVVAGIAAVVLGVVGWRLASRPSPAAAAQSSSKESAQVEEAAAPEESSEDQQLYVDPWGHLVNENCEELEGEALDKAIERINQGEQPARAPCRGRGKGKNKHKD